MSTLQRLDPEDLDLHEVLNDTSSLLYRDGIEADRARRAPLHIQHVHPTFILSVLNSLQESLARINLARW